MSSENKKENDNLAQELEALRSENAKAKQYIRRKVNQLLTVMGTSPLRAEELDDATLIELDPIGIVSDSFVQILRHLKETNEQLKEAHDEITAIFDSAGMGILVLDRDLRVLTFNKKLEDQFRINRDRAPGTACYELICKRRHPPDTCPFGKTLETGKTCRNDMVLDGRNYDVVATPVGDADRPPSRIVLVYMDTTERILAQEKLRKSEERYRDLFENATDLIQILGANSSIRYVNKAWRETLGYREEEIPGLSIFDVIHPECVHCGPEFENVVSGRKDGRFETMFITKSGETINVEGNVSAVYEEGVFAGTRGIFRDITERKRVETLIAAEREQLAVTLRSIGDGVITTDIRGNITVINRVAERLTGWNRADARGTSISAVFHAEDEKTREPIRLPLESEAGTPRVREQEHEVILLSRDGAERLVEVRFAPILDREGATTGAVIVFRDITEKKKLEERVIKSEKIESLGVLAGGIAHDFNNLLQGVFGHISLAKKSMDRKEKALAMLELAEKALHQSVNLTTQLLTFSKGGKPVKKPINVRPVIEDSVKFALSGSRCGASLAIADDLRPVDADEGQVGQVIQNIVLNADQAMPAGGTVTVRAENKAQGDASLPPGSASGDYIAIAIQDAGTGIPEYFLNKIFDPYFTTKEKGSGLGLATCYSIVRNHGGMIDVRTKSGEGSTFTVYLPALTPDTIIASATGAPPSPFHRPARVLVMDDEEIIRIFCNELLRSMGHDVELAEHGEEALQKYQQAAAEGKPFDIVLLDLTIRGGMGGAETMQQLMAIDPAVKAIVSSGYSDDDVATDYEQLGFKAFLKKPYEIDELGEVLNTVLGSDAAGAPGGD